MCEWLSSVQWCDVHLVCCGRSFSAHRAVLASVSRFLRRVLLSCPQEETPTFIVLPDFDLEALSSVLYYIYNGEVIVDKPKLLMFLDVIKTLEIFIDNQDLQKLRDSVGDRNLDLCTYRECRLYENVFALSTGNSDGQEYVNIRKGECSRNTCLQYALSDSDLVDKPECNRWREAQPSSDYPQATFVDRQRNSYLRDSYIETYPQNGNVNGLTQGVLAISNERYRAPTSVLLPNANGKLPSRAGDTFLEISRKTADLSTYKTDAPRKPRIQNSTQQNDEPSSRRFHDFKNLDFNDTKIGVKKICHLGNSLDNSWLRICPPNLIPPSLENQKIRSTLPNSLMPSLDLTKTKSNADYEAPSPSNNSQNYLATVDLPYRNLNRNLRKSPMDRRCSMRNNITKAPIFNQVLDSPWCPRLPYNYKPFRRKLNDAPDFERHDKKENKVTSDTNNNDEQLVLTVQCESVADVDTHNAKEEFKCAVCNQMFTSDKCLSTHMKRHSTAARYSCGECGKTFSQLRNFKYHMSVHRGTREFAATCTVCGKYFNDRGYLSSHMKIHRNRKEYKCTLCPKSFNQRVAYNMHVRIHTGVKPHVCEECGKAFSRKMLLKQHQRTHSGERPYACAHCDKRFADRSNMTLHLRLHTGVKPFSCSLCPKSFTKKHHLKSHLNFHTGAKPYSCPRCNLAFTQSSNMRTHMKKCNASHNETNT